MHVTRVTHSGFTWDLWCFLSHPSPSATYMYQWTRSPLVQVKFKSKPRNLIHENASQNVVCEVAAIFPGRGWVDLLHVEAIWRKVNTIFNFSSHPTLIQCRLLISSLLEHIEHMFAADDHTITFFPQYIIDQNIIAFTNWRAGRIA